MYNLVLFKHDDGEECTPYFDSKDEPDDGFYLMHSVASAVSKQNNRIFSNCSIEVVAQLLTDPFYTACFEGNYSKAFPSGHLC